jgi:hypothetical protein
VAFFVIIVLAFIGVIVWQYVESQHAVATTSVLTRYTPEQAAEIIMGAFGGARSVLWTRASGPGTINMRRRGRAQGITMSIDLTPEANGVTRIDMWSSAYSHYLGVLIGFAGVVNRRKRAIGRLLAEPDTAQLANSMYGGQGAPAPAGQPNADASAGSGVPSYIQQPSYGQQSGQAYQHQAYQHQPYDQQ